MAAPNVSLNYWRETTKRYSEYTLKNNSPEKKFASLLANEVQPALTNFMESGDFEDAKLIWVIRENRIKEEVNDNSNKYLIPSTNCFSMNEEVTNMIEKKLKSLSKDY